MSGGDQTYRSRLQPTRGIGAAYPENHSRIGSPDPEQAARLASMSEEQAEAERERVEKMEYEAEGRREELLNAIVGKSWVPSGSVGWDRDNPLPAKVAAELKKMSTEAVAELYREMTQAVESSIDAQAEEILRDQLRGSLNISPDDPLYNPMMDKARRQRIEASLRPLSFEDMVFKGYTEQSVPLRDGFVVSLRTIMTLHGLWLEYFMSRLEETSMQHTTHTFSLMQVACSLHAINDRPIGPDLARYTKDNAETRDAFKKVLDERMELLGKLPSPLSDDLIVQYTWFNGRVQKLLAGDLMRKVGNS